MSEQKLVKKQRLKQNKFGQKKRKQKQTFDQKKLGQNRLVEQHGQAMANTMVKHMCGRTSLVRGKFCQQNAWSNRGFGHKSLVNKAKGLEPKWRWILWNIEQSQGS